MNSGNIVYNPILGEIGCKFRCEIQSHISILGHSLCKGDDVEWLLGPLDAISHSSDIVIDAYRFENRLGSCYELYFHNKLASQTYVAYDRNYTEREIEILDMMNEFREKRGEELIDLNPKPFDKTMVIKDTLNSHVSYTIPSIWDELMIPFSEVGIWQAVLLNETRAMFPTGWHANYMKKIYVFSKAEDLQKVFNRYSEVRDANIEQINAERRSRGEKELTKSNFDWISPFMDRDDIMPSVKVDGDNAVVNYCYWNDWSGFCRVSVPVERQGQSVTIREPQKEVLFGYSCNIIY